MAAAAPAAGAGAGAGLVYRVDDPQWLAIAAGARALEYFEQAVGPEVVAVVKAAHPADWLKRCQKAVGGSVAAFMTESAAGTRTRSSRSSTTSCRCSSRLV